MEQNEYHPYHGLDNVQDRILGWLRSVSLTDPDTSYQYKKLLEETSEVFMAYMEGAEEHEIMSEVADVMFACIGILGLHGYSAEEMLTDQVRVNETKYDSRTYQMYRASGKTHAEAMHLLKSSYKA